MQHIFFIRGAKVTEIFKYDPNDLIYFFLKKKAQKQELLIKDNLGIYKK